MQEAHVAELKRSNDLKAGIPIIKRRLSDEQAAIISKLAADCPSLRQYGIFYSSSADSDSTYYMESIARAFKAGNANMQFSGLSTQDPDDLGVMLGTCFPAQQDQRLEAIKSILEAAKINVTMFKLDHVWNGNICLSVFPEEFPT